MKVNENQTMRTMKDVMGSLDMLSYTLSYEVEQNHLTSQNLDTAVAVLEKALRNVKRIKESIEV